MVWFGCTEHPNNSVNIKNTVQDERGIKWIQINAENYTGDKTFTLQVIQRKWIFNSWWRLLLLEMFAVGFLFFYFFYTITKMKGYYDFGLQTSKISTVINTFLMLYSVFHFAKDTIYCFNFPHFNWFFAFMLLLSLLYSIVVDISESYDPIKEEFVGT